jgi:hypothetical protein
MPRMTLALRVPVGAVAPGTAAMGARSAARPVWASVPAVAALPSARRPEGVAVGLALPVAVLAESTLPVPVLAAALTVAEWLAMPAAVAGPGGAVHRELGNRTGRRVAFDSRQRGADQAPVQADLGMRRWRLGFGGLGRL